LTLALEDYKDVWVFLEREGDHLSDDSLGLLAAGKKVSDEVEEKLVGVLLGYHLGQIPQEAVEFGADTVIAIDHPELGTYLTSRIIDTLAQLIKERKPYALIFLAAEFGREIAPRLASKVGTGLATDNVDFVVEDYFNPKLNQSFHNIMIQVRPDFGTRVAKIYTPRHRPQLATLKPGSFEPLRREPGRKGDIQRVPLPNPEKVYPARVLELAELPKPKVDLEHAQVVIGLGMGILKGKDGSPKNPVEAYKLAKRLKDLIEKKWGLKTEIGASRALVMAEVKSLEGVISRENELGQTGVQINPELYIALGVSGSAPHRAGIRAKKILAVNPDPGAGIFLVAQYSVVGDLYEFLPRMISALEALPDGR
jgi:electron transfer flavoprotein alpha subunit